MRDSGCGSSRFQCLLFMYLFRGRGRDGGRVCTLNCIINSIQIKLNSHSLTHHTLWVRVRVRTDLNWNFVILPFQNHCTNSTQFSFSFSFILSLSFSFSFVRSFVLFVLRFNQEVFNCVVYFNWQLTISSRIYFSYPLRASHQQFIPLTSPQTEARSQPGPLHSALCVWRHLIELFRTTIIITATTTATTTSQAMEKSRQEIKRFFAQCLFGFFSRFFSFFSPVVYIINF